MNTKQRVFTSFVSVLCIAAVFLSCNTTSKAKTETLNADYVVVGGGAAGLMSALELSQKGKVVLLEKMPGLGGTSIRAKGFLWSIDSALNKASGKGLTAQQMFDYYKGKAGEENFNAAFFQAMLDVSGSVVDDLLQKGMPFSKDRMIPGTPNYPQLLCLTVDGEGPAMIAKFKELLQKNNVEILLNTRAVELIIKDGAVQGVVAEQDGKKYNVFAQKTVLATGGFAKSKKLMAKYNKEFADNVAFCGTGSTGDGITMAMAAGAQVTGDGVLGIWGMNDYYGYVGDIGSLVRQTAVYVNKEGKRFVNEKRYYAEVHKELNKITDKLAYGIFDSSNPAFVANLEKARAENLSVKADTLEALAAKLNINAANFKAAIESYNTAHAAGQDGDFGIKNKVMTPVLKAPFYAIEVRPTIIGTINGLKVNEKTEVLNEKNTAIPNLYATGELVIGNFVNNEYPTTGTVLATCLYSGKIAADNASRGVTAKYSASSAKKMSADTQKVKKSNAVYTDGVYTGEAKGMNAPVKVEVSVKGKKIAAVKVLSHSETPGISDPAFERIPAAMVKANSFEVDGVSGATMTSKALIEAAKLALKNAQ
ncbi:FAD-dependent oxidoreductase [Treponema sp. HNW]|uniref:FAD-dependent oxidoreductase n=1 Tax=Treponema sp. HNW TaxID=3116654 RepID=UPI003D0F775C